MRIDIGTKKSLQNINKRVLSTIYVEQNNVILSIKENKFKQKENTLSTHRLDVRTIASIGMFTHMFMPNTIVNKRSN